MRPPAATSTAAVLCTPAQPRICTGNDDPLKLASLAAAEFGRRRFNGLVITLDHTTVIFQRNFTKIANNRLWSREEEGNFVLLCDCDKIIINDLERIRT